MERMLTPPTQHRKYEEQIGVKMPDGSRYMVTVIVSVHDSDEEILQRITKQVGTVFNVTGTKYRVTSSEPFRLKKLKEDEDVSSVEAASPEPVAVQDDNQPTPQEDEPKSERRLAAPVAPAVGERWKPRDPRRKTSFLVVEIDGDHAVTDDGRRVQLARFWRYERLSGPETKVS